MSFKSQLQKLRSHPTLWRFVGFVSTLVGLPCFAVSLSFQRLFGKWDFFRGYLYALVSFIIFGIMLFGYKLRISSNFLLKAHLEFFVFTIISLYSFFYDRANIPNSDVLSLISCAAFSVMLLSLSRQIDSGFVVDLLNFFLGSFAIHLMNTKKIVPILVAAAFCYSLILIRCYSDDSKHPSRTAQAQKQNGVLKEVDNSRTEELYKILQIEKLGKDTVICEANLREAITAGFEKECCWVYGSWRRQILEENLSIMELRKLNIEEIQKMPWNEVQDKIERWIRASKSCLGILFYYERQVCDRFFAGFSHTMYQTFMEVCQASVSQLLDFANAIAIGSRSTECLFKIIDMYETLRSLMPEFENLFSDQYCVVLKNEAITTLKRLREAIKGIFEELENMIRQDTDKAPTKASFPEGVHPIAKYVMNYLDASCKSWEILEHVFEGTDQAKRDEISVSSSLSAQMVRIVDLLETNLEAKFKTYKDSALGSVFMMKNWMYIVQISNDNQLGTLLGDDWITKQTEKVQKYQELLNPRDVIMEPNTAAKSADGRLKVLKILGGSKGKLLRDLKRRVQFKHK